MQKSLKNAIARMKRQIEQHPDWYAFPELVEDNAYEYGLTEAETIFLKAKLLAFCDKYGYKVTNMEIARDAQEAMRLQQASEEHDALMNSIGEEDLCIAAEIERGGFEENYTIADLVANAEYRLELNLAPDAWLGELEENGSDEEWQRFHSENRKLRNFIKKWR